MLTLFLLGAALAAPAAAVTLFVDWQSPSPAPPYASWTTAARTIQAAVDAAQDGDLILVAAGNYNSGGRPAPGKALTNRVTIAKAVTVASSSGAGQTFIVGSGPVGNAAIRCAYLTNGAALNGFTLERGRTRVGSAAWSQDASGGGAYLDHGGSVSGCVVRANAAYFGGGVFLFGGTAQDLTVVSNTALAQPASGGGAYCYGGVISNSLLRANTASYGGGAFCDEGGIIDGSRIVQNTAAQLAGGVFCASGGMVRGSFLGGNTAGERGGGSYCWRGGTARNALISTNRAADGAGVYCDRGGRLENCTVASNTADGAGGGLYSWFGSRAVNSILYGNSATDGRNWFSIGGSDVYSYVCTTPSPPRGDHNIFVNPQFANPAQGNYRLASSSPCLDRAIQLAWMPGAYDLDGRPRIWINSADLGCFELNPTNLNADTDGDFIPDWWEWKYFGHVINTAPGFDGDVDEYGALEEYVAGTDPNDGNSLLAMTRETVRGTGAIITWSSAADRWYTITRMTNLIRHAGTVIADGVAATPPMNTYTDTTLQARSAVYKIQVRMQP